MPTFTVHRKESVVSAAEIEARDEAHALQIARALEGTENQPKYAEQSRSSPRLSIPGYSPRKGDKPDDSEQA
jgi:hypothetical protein